MTLAAAIAFSVPQTIPDERIRDLLCAAFEGGSNSWYQIKGKVLAPGLTLADFKEGGKMQPPDDYYHWAELIPLTEGCHLLIGDVEDPSMAPVPLGREQIAAGLLAMQEKYPRHFADAVGEGGDADTGDCFLQCCLFGHLVYG